MEYAARARPPRAAARGPGGRNGKSHQKNTQNYQHVLPLDRRGLFGYVQALESAAARGKARCSVRPPHRSQILAIATTSSGGAYPFTLLSGSSLCISAVQLGTKEAGICQQDAPTV